MKKQLFTKRTHTVGHSLAACLLATIVLISGMFSEGADGTEPLSADFVMTRTLSALSDSIKSSGKLFLGGPGLLRWEMTAPARSVLVVNGDTAWIHYPDMGVTKGFDLSTDPVMGVLSSHLLALTVGDFNKLDDFYFVTDGAVKGSKLLKPKQEAVKKVFSELRVVADAAGVVSVVELVSQNGDVTRIEFQNVIVGTQLPPSLFEKPEKGK